MPGTATALTLEGFLGLFGVWEPGFGREVGVEEEAERGATRRMRATATILATKSRASTCKISSNVSKVMYSDSLRATLVVRGVPACCPQTTDVSKSREAF